MLTTLAILSSGCAGQLPRITADLARKASRWWPGITQEQLALGRSLYVRRCSGCHALILPSKHPPQRWEAEVGKMAAAAKLDSSETRTIARYLIAASNEFMELTIDP